MSSETMIAEQREAALKSLSPIFQRFEAAAGQQKAKSNELQTAAQATLSEKEQLFADAADLAFKASWVDDACEAAITMALAARGDAQKLGTVKTFASQLRLAMHSRVRTAVPALFALGREQWAKEQEALKANKKAPAPLSTAWPRCTHMLVACMRDIKEHQGNSFPDSAALIDFAIRCDPKTDEEKIAAKLKAMVRTFDAFRAEFPLEAFASITGFLGKIDAKVLKAARDKALAEKRGETAPAPQSNLRGANGEVKPAAAEPVAGASDIIGDALSEYNAAA